VCDSVVDLGAVPVLGGSQLAAQRAAAGEVHPPDERDQFRDRMSSATDLTRSLTGVVPRVRVLGWLLATALVWPIAETSHQTHVWGLPVSIVTC
jgi:hypothetical protein